MNERKPKAAPEMTDSFDRWLADNLPDPQEDALEGRIHLAVLRERLRHQRRRRHGRGLLPMIVPVLVFMTALFRVGDLGSDDFDLSLVASGDGTLEALVHGMNRVGMQILPGDDPSNITEMIHQGAAGETRIKEVRGWEIDGAEFWSIELEFESGGMSESRFSNPKSQGSELTPEIARFIVSKEWEGFDRRIRGGEIKPLGTRTVELDGVPCTVATYVLDSRTCGEVVFSLGRPIP